MPYRAWATRIGSRDNLLKYFSAGRDGHRDTGALPTLLAYAGFSVEEKQNAAEVAAGAAIATSRRSRAWTARHSTALLAASAPDSSSPAFTPGRSGATASAGPSDCG